MPTQRDYLIATLMGEDNRADRQGMQGILDVIANRADQFSRYGATSGSYKDVVTARGGLEFNAWMPNDNSFARTNRALQGADAMQGAEVGQYKQAASVVDDFLSKGEGRGISQGATFYQTPTAPNKYQSGTLWPKYGNITIGNHVYTGDKLVKDKGEYQKLFPSYFQPALNAPAPGTDYFGKSLDVSGDVANGPIGSGPQGSVFDTSDPYGFGLIDASGNIGPGSNNLGNATPLGPAPGKYDFASGGLVGPIGDANFGAGLAANQPAPGPFDFSRSYLEANPDVAAAGMGAFEHYARFGAKEGRVIDTAGDRFDPSAYLSQNADVLQAGQDALTHYLSYGAAEGRAAPIIGPDGTARNVSSLGVTPTISAMLAPFLQPQGVAPSVPAPTGLTLGPSPSQTATDIPGLYRNILGREGGAEELAYWQGQLAQGNSLSSIEAQFIASPEAQARGVQASDFARTLGAPGLSPLQGPQTAPTIGPTAGQTVTASPGIGDYDFSSAYLGANQDVAQAGMGAWEHFLRFGAKEGRALNAAGDRFDANKYLSQNADVLQAGEDPLLHYVKYGAAEGRAAPLIGADGTASTIQSLGLTPTISAELTRFLQPQGLAPTIGAPALSPLIGAGPATQAWSQGTVSPFGFGGNVSQGVPNGSFGAGITPQAPISNWGFSGANVGGGLGAQPQSLGGSYAVGSAVSNMGMDLPGATGISDYSFGNADVSGFDANQGGGTPAPQEAPSASGYGDGGSIAGRNSQLSQNEYFATQARQQALATANNNLFGQQITGIAPGNQTVYDYATGRATGGPAPQIQQTAFTPVNMGGVFAPLATAAFMPRFSF